MVLLLIYLKQVFHWILYMNKLLLTPWNTANRSVELLLSWGFMTWFCYSVQLGVCFMWVVAVLSCNLLRPKCFSSWKSTWSTQNSWKYGEIVGQIFALFLLLGKWMSHARTILSLSSQSWVMISQQQRVEILMGLPFQIKHYQRASPWTLLWPLWQG